MRIVYGLCVAALVIILSLGVFYKLGYSNESATIYEVSGNEVTVETEDGYHYSVTVDNFAYEVGEKVDVYFRWGKLSKIRKEHEDEGNLHSTHIVGV